MLLMVREVRLIASHLICLVQYRELRVEILNMTYSMVLKSVAKSQVLFTPPFLKTMERFAPLPFSSLVKVNSMRHLLYLVDNNLV
eukprot:m.107042 g.107042  ORF g.107042 m.107042 type:complete len:85 (+) comp13315_c0_seq9:2271-2525(+)